MDFDALEVPRARIPILNAEPRKTVGELDDGFKPLRDDTLTLNDPNSLEALHRSPTKAQWSKIAGHLTKGRVIPDANLAVPLHANSNHPKIELYHLETPQPLTHLSSQVAWINKGFELPAESTLFDGLPTPTQVQQGYLRDCWAIAVLASGSQFEPSELMDRIKEVSQGVYQVRIGGPDIGYERIHTIDASVPKGTAYVFEENEPYVMDIGEVTASSKKGVLWPLLFEKALSLEHPEGYDGLNQGGFAVRALQYLLNRPTGELMFFDPSKPISPDGQSYFMDDSEWRTLLDYQWTNKLPTVFGVEVNIINDIQGIEDSRSNISQTIDQSGQLGNDVLYGTNKPVRLHEYWLYDYDPIQQRVRLGNPNDPETPTSWLTFQDLRNCVNSVSYGKKRSDGS